MMSFLLGPVTSSALLLAGCGLCRTTDFGAIVTSAHAREGLRSGNIGRDVVSAHVSELEQTSGSLSILASDVSLCDN